MPQYLSETEGFPVVLGLLDEKVVLDNNRGGFCQDPISPENIESMLAGWFFARANLTQSFVGDIDCVIRLCELRLKCLTSRGDFDNASVPIKQVHRLWQSDVDVSLQRMLLDEVQHDHILTSVLHQRRVPSIVPNVLPLVAHPWSSVLIRPRWIHMPRRVWCPSKKWRKTDRRQM
jgi:hypothetical protein